MLNNSMAMLATSAISMGYSLKRAELERVCQKGVHGMPAFMYHGGNIMHLSGGIHKNKWRAAFCKRTIIATGCLPLPAIQIEVAD